MRAHFITSKGYHRKMIRDTFANFEERETTISHRFRESHPFLHNKAYGEAFFHALGQHCEGLNFGHVLEIGGGQGDFARAFAPAWFEQCGPSQPQYTVLDLSDSLLRSQRQSLEGLALKTNFVQADAERLPFADGCFQGLVIANEMLADLDVWRLHPGSKQLGRAHLPEVTCVGRQNAHFNPELIGRCLMRYQVLPFLRHPGILFPIGLVLLLEQLFRLACPGTTVILTEYFEREGGGVVHHFHRHRECSFNLNLVCHLAQRIGFTVRGMSLVDFLDLRITEPVATRPLLAFSRDVLGHDLSVTIPYTSGQLVELLHLPDRSLDGFLSRADLQRQAASFHVLILGKPRPISKRAFTRDLVVQKAPGHTCFTSRGGDSYLVTSYPFVYHQVNETGAFLWDQIDGKKSLAEIAWLLAGEYDLTSRHALRDTLAFVRHLHANRCVVAATCS